MHIEKIKLLNFRNYHSLEISLGPQINCLVGSNGAGKTNLLDAIYYLSFTKGMRSSIDLQNINHDKDFFTITGDYQTDKPHRIHCAFKSGLKKFEVDKQEYDRLREHIGRFPAVLIAPAHEEIVKDYSEIRRKFFDGILSQIDHNYLSTLIEFQRLLRQRNSLLKQFNERNSYDPLLLDSLDEPMIELGLRIFEFRQNFLKRFVPSFARHYATLSGGSEPVDIEYRTTLGSDNYRERYFKARDRDRARERTSIGPHRDDFLFSIEGFPIKRYGSQGQQKSFLIGLKLAEFEIIKEEKGVAPILLLDDIFDKLDESRLSKLLELISEQTFGQIILTDARPERSKTLLADINIESRFFLIKDNKAEITS